LAVLMGGPARHASTLTGVAGRPAPEGKFVVVQVGSDPVSTLYLAKKKEMAEKLGIDFVLRQYDNNISQDELLIEIGKLNEEPSIKGILVQLPLPQHLNRVKIAGAVSAQKDIDGFHCILGKKKYKCVPPTVLAIDELLDFYQIEKTGKKILIVGEGFLVGKPLANFWRGNNLDVSILEIGGANYQEKLKKAEIVVIATGGGGHFSPKDFRTGAVVIDASTVSVGGKFGGDVSRENWPGDKHLAPVPGGVGPVTVAMLFRNFFEL